MQSKIKINTNNILYINFNQDFSCISVGTQIGYIIYNVSPFKKMYERSNP
jgi:autophagy-related protein 18